MTNQLCKNIFPEIFSDGHLRYRFDKRAIVFPKKVQVSLLKVRTNEKKQFFKVKFPQMFPLNTCIAVLAHLNSLFATGEKKFLQIQISNKKHSFSGKRIDFPQNFPVDARMAFMTTLKKIFWIKLLFFFVSNSKEIWNNVQSFKHVFFLKVFQGYVGYSSDNSGELFRQSRMKSLLKLLKI